VGQKKILIKFPSGPFQGGNCFGGIIYSSALGLNLPPLPYSNLRPALTAVSLLKLKPPPGSRRRLKIPAGTPTVESFRYIIIVFQSGDDGRGYRNMLYKITRGGRTWT
jgi:hypothetical protein